MYCSVNPPQPPPPPPPPWSTPPAPAGCWCYQNKWHHGNTLFCHTFTSTLSQQLLHKMTNSRAAIIVCIHTCKCQNLAKKTQYLALILSDKLCTSKMELQLEVNFYLDSHWVTRPWWPTLTNGSDIKEIFPWCQKKLLLESVQAEWWWFVTINYCVRRK